MSKKQKSQDTKILHWITVPPIGFSIMLNVGFTYDEVMKHLKRLKATEWAQAISRDKEFYDSVYMAGSKRTVTFDGKDRTYYFIWLRDCFDFTDNHYICLAHEVLHICQFALPDYFERDRETEFEAYTHTYIMEECLKAIRGHNS